MFTTKLLFFFSFFPTHHCHPCSFVVVVLFYHFMMILWTSNVKNGPILVHIPYRTIYQLVFYRIQNVLYIYKLKYIRYICNYKLVVNKLIIEGVTHWSLRRIFVYKAMHIIIMNYKFYHQSRVLSNSTNSIQFG